MIKKTWLVIALTCPTQTTDRRGLQSSALKALLLDGNSQLKLSHFSFGDWFK